MRISVATARQLHRAVRRSLQASTTRCFSSTAAPLPEGLREISSVPRTPSWSLKELHQDGELNAADTVLTEEKLRELAELCHLHVKDEKLPGLLKDVESIIQCTKTIQAMTLNENIDDVYAKSDFDAGVVAPLRDDVVTEGDCAEKVLANAAEKSGYYFKVPKVLQD
ncbi:aspartyl/glutamyl-tRNA(Asn/Gln) amidotransferase, C subunit [Phytophthora nicotianae CJ01A1]|uniref:Aspartyl/glutamyl-tRNA(Asn/Gln) amidotransferase, C subunit n=1 Tax=Phytophthora nicotianae CJ01A1 TaxID=1317063 RepID=W2WP26_PHYNI|nr:aspartyl/glutamyl-tRNA(Asn/Gln) amidotransferase, C subunit [Phytophthora nicotianae CJ01A1]